MLRRYPHLKEMGGGRVMLVPATPRETDRGLADQCNQRNLILRRGAGAETARPFGSERAASLAYVLPNAFGESAKARRRRSRYMRHSLGLNRLTVTGIGDRDLCVRPNAGAQLQAIGSMRVTWPPAVVPSSRSTAKLTFDCSNRRASYLPPSRLTCVAAAERAKHSVDPPGQHYWPQTGYRMDTRPLAAELGR